MQNVSTTFLFILNQIINFYVITHVGIATAIFLVFWLLRKTLTNFILKLLLKLTDKTTTTMDDHIVLAFQKPLQHFFAIIGLYFALLYLPLTVGQNLFIAKTFRSAFIILLSLGFYNFVSSYAAVCEDVGKLLGINIDKILVPFFAKILKALVIILALTMIAQEWNYEIGSFIAGLGLGGLAFALAAKDTLANIFGGIVIITDKPFSIGDWIYTPSVEGTVEDINFRSTKIRTFAQALVTVPNATLANEAITNWSRMGKRRVTFTLGVTYSTPKNKLAKCVTDIKEMLSKHPQVHPETIFVHFDSYGDSSLNIFLYFFTTTTNWGEYLQVKEDINFSIMDILEQQNIAVAFPSTSVYFESPLQTKAN